MSQNAAFEKGDFDTLDEQLLSIMKSIHEKCKLFGSDDNQIDYVKGANLAAFDKVSNAMLAFGVH